MLKSKLNYLCIFIHNLIFLNFSTKNMNKKFVIPSNKEFPKDKWGFADIKVFLRKEE